MKRKDNNSVGILFDQWEAATMLNLSEYINNILDGVFGHPILDGGAKKPLPP